MKKYLFIIFFLISITAKAQLLIQFQNPPTGIITKPQLWNLIVTNSGNTTLDMYIELTYSEMGSGLEVMTAVTRNLNFPPGITIISADLISPIQYNLINSNFAMDANPNGFLPVGNFYVCYSFIKYGVDYTEILGEECQDISVHPMSPPLLVFPFDETSTDDVKPQFSWIPPSPLNLFSNLNYDFQIVELNEGQTPEDALVQNLPLFEQENIYATSLMYPISAPALELGKNYAWRIYAKSNNQRIIESEAWQFNLKTFGQMISGSHGDQPYAKVRFEDDGAYAVFNGILKFDYLNEGSDSIWNVTVTDLSSPDRIKFILPMDSFPLKRGQNLIKYPVYEISKFINKHYYILEITNSQKNVARLRFEYRSPEESN